MHVRDLVNSHPLITMVVAGLLCIGAILYATRQPAAPPAPGLPPQAFFTVDDGKTVFSDDLAKLPPFDHDGQTAVRAMVMTTDGGQHRWTAYLLKYSDDLKRQVDADGGKLDPLKMQGMIVTERLVKKPGAAKWVSTKDFAAYQKICTPVPPADVPQGPATAVEP